MATLDSLKLALREKATQLSTRPLSDTEYSAGFELLSQESAYQKFIIPQLSQLLAPLFHSRSHVSVLEIGPGPKSVLGSLSIHLRRKIKTYAAFEPNNLFATKLEECCRLNREDELPFPCLGSPADIRRRRFALASESGTSPSGDDGEKFDVILFCHSMYGMKPKRAFVERALELLVKRPGNGMVVVFHRAELLHFDGLVCHQTASFPVSTIQITDRDEILDHFAPIVAGFAVQGSGFDETIRTEWRQICRALSGSAETHPDHLLFSSSNVMVAFNQYANKLPDLIAQVPLSESNRMIKNSQARFHLPGSMVKPTKIQHVQQCVRWALENGLSLTVLGGAHSGQCIWPNIVSVDMGAFDQIHVLTAVEDGAESNLDIGPLVVAEAGCKTGDIVRKTVSQGLAVPLGSRPSVGAGLWLQGGIGHLARQHGLTCDAIVGAVLVSVDSGQIFHIGHVPNQHRPTDAVRPAHEDDLLWAVKGAGTNFGIIVSVTFKACKAPMYATRNWITPLSNRIEAQRKLSDFDNLIAKKLPADSSADAYLFWSADQLHLGVTLYEFPSAALTPTIPTTTARSVQTILGKENDSRVVDGVGLFETEMYMSSMHGGHGGGKTSAFKRCLLLKDIVSVAKALVVAVENRPSPLCYLHLLHGGGAVAEVAAEVTAFGCRNWDFACIVTAVWKRDQDGTDAARYATKWVYDVAKDLLPFSSGVYCADLGPDPRDFDLSAKAFGPNRWRLARLKRQFDPYNILACACPLPKAQRLIILVTGESCAGKDHCADVWVTCFTQNRHTARAVSISDAIKHEYAAVSGADAGRLLRDRAYREEHRSELTAFFKAQVQKQPWLPEQHFLHVVHNAPDTDVLLITGMRDEAPVATWSHLAPSSRVLELRVEASRKIRRIRLGSSSSIDDADDRTDSEHDDSREKSSTVAAGYSPNLTFNNDTAGNEAAERFAESTLLPFLHHDLERLADMVRSTSDFPRFGVDFCHVLDIAQQPGGLSLCLALLRAHFAGDWSKVDAVACCESGGFVFGSALAAMLEKPLVLIREAGKLPPPTASVLKFPSHVSSLLPDCSGEKRIEMNLDGVRKGMSVVVVDDVLATGQTLAAVLQLLGEAGIRTGDVSVMTVAEFPIHRGRELLRQHGYGTVNVQSLLVFGCA